jgi:hypothetical protein
LIVSPHFPPVNTADMQRVRMLLPFFRENDWEAEVLAVDPDQVNAPRDPWLEADLPRDVRVHRVRGLSPRWSRIPGFGTIGLRILNALRRRGNQLLRDGSFDLVYFSTTVMEVHILGPYWRRKFKVPFVMDYQDPWVSDYFRNRPAIVPPGGRAKFFLAEFLHRWMEPRVLRRCSGITSVSPAYPTELQERYPFAVRSLVLPFPGSSRDIARLESGRATQTRFKAGDGYLHWVYVGVVVPGMLKPIRAVFQAVSKDQDLRNRVRFHFIGTSYAPAGRATSQVVEAAHEFGLADSVTEFTDRVSYAEMLCCLRDADALLAFGSDEASYTPSKIYPYLLARRPLLAIFHRMSPVIDVLNKVGGAVCIPFDSDDLVSDLAARIAENWLAGGQSSRSVPLNEAAFETYSDRAGSVAISRFFDRCLAGQLLPSGVTLAEDRR